MLKTWEYWQRLTGWRVKKNGEELVGYHLECVKPLAAQERCDCWNVPDEDGNTPTMKATKQSPYKNINNEDPCKPSIQLI